MSTSDFLLAVVLCLVTFACLFAIYRSFVAQRENPPTGRFLDIDGVRLHFVEKGAGPALVLLHGNGSMIQDFESSGIVDMAARKYRVIVFDRPGYGHSTRPRARRWNAYVQAEIIFKALQQLGIERPIVVGHSWGTFVAQALAIEHRGYVRGLVLMSGYYFVTFRPDVLVFSPPALPLVGDVLRYTVSPLIGRLMWPGILRLIFGPAPVPRRFSRFPMWMALRPTQLRASASESGLMIPSVLSLQHRYRELDAIPTVVMAGEDDRFVRAKRHSVRFHDEVARKSELRVVPTAGHMVHQTAPTEVISAIDWVAAHAGGPAPTVTPTKRIHSVEVRV